MIYNDLIMKTTNGEGKTQRYHSLDKLKVLCAFLIVCIHAPFPGVFGEYFTALTRIAVPIFFMISGFFWNPVNAKKQIIKLLMLMLCANIAYFVLDLMRVAMEGDVEYYLQTTFSMKNILCFVLLNNSPFAPHLWYLGAIIYVLLFFSVAERYRIKKKLLYITPVLLICDLLLGKYSLTVFHKEFPYVLVRNWIFVGIPYFMIGNLIHDKKTWIQEHISRNLLIGGILTFSATSLLERFLLVSAGLNATRDHYTSTTLLAVAVFLIFLYYVSNRNSFISKIGKQDGTWIYILHYFFIIVLGVIIRTSSLAYIYSVIRPIVVFLVTTGIVEVIYRIVRKMNRVDKKQS